MKIPALLAAAALLCAAEPPAQYRAFWADAFHVGFKTPAEVDRMLDDLVTAKANAILVEARHRGAVYYLNSTEPRTEDATWQRGFDVLEYTISKAREKGIEVHLWSPVTPVWDAARTPSDPAHIWNTHGPDAKGGDLWLTATAAGKLAKSLDLGHPTAARYTADVFIDALRNYALDGIHLDYIRYPEDDRYGWNPTALARFNRLYARDGVPADNDAAWSDFRRRQVTDFVRQVFLRAYEVRPKAKVTASVVTWGNGPLNDTEFRSKDAYSRVFQDWPRWLEEGILDFAMPMNYFDNTRYSAYLDRWLEFEKNNQYGRGILPGLGIYLNTVPSTLSQVDRVLAPSETGKQVPGIALYSYASTNTLVNGVPQPPAAEFYKQIGEYFKEPAGVPGMAWKETPSTGMVLGNLVVEGGAAHLVDAVDVVVQSDTNPDFVRKTSTDGTGFYGMLNLPPDRYYVRLSRAGRELFRTVPVDVAAGAAMRFDVFLKEADFAALTPRVVGSREQSAAPGSVILLDVADLAVPFTPASTVPLPRSLAGVQVFVNGAPAALSSVSNGKVEVQLPFQAATEWQIQVRFAGLDSAPFVLQAAEAMPRIVEVRRTEWGAEIVATGLGMVSPAPSVGAGGSAEPPYQTLTGRISVLHRGAELKVLWAGLEPYQPYRYQINVEGSALDGELVVVVNGVASAPFGK